MSAKDFITPQFLRTLLFEEALCTANIKQTAITLEIF
jgi:hypothetical protein